MKTVIVGVVGLIVGALVGLYGLAPGGGDGGGEAPSAEVASSAGEDTIRWKMASSFPGELVQLGTLGKRFEAKVQTASNDSLRLKFYEPGALVPALEIFDAVSSGSLDAGWSSSGYWAGKIPALQFFAAVPFGPNPGEYLAWLQFGGGVELRQELYAAHNIHALHCGMISPEGSGWFREEINSVEDLKGLKMRFFGLGAKVMEKLGVSTQLLAGGDIFPALELGTIDATEFSMPAIDLDLGFHQVAKHYYFPGWHQPSSLLELIINKERWDGVDAQRQQLTDHRNRLRRQCHPLGHRRGRGDPVRRARGTAGQGRYPAPLVARDYGRARRRVGRGGGRGIGGQRGLRPGLGVAPQVPRGLQTMERPWPSLGCPPYVI